MKTGQINYYNPGQIACALKLLILVPIVVLATPNILMNNFPALGIATEISMLYFLHRFNIRT